MNLSIFIYVYTLTYVDIYIHGRVDRLRSRNRVHPVRKRQCETSARPSVYYELTPAMVTKWFGKC